jgi:uncharacterized membrane protein YqjE
MADSHLESGLFASVRRMLGTVLEIAQVRLELLGTELEFEKRRLLDGLLWGALGLMVVGVGLVLACGFVILLFWEGYRLPALGVLTMLFLGMGAWLLQEAKRRLHQREHLFSQSVTELKHDRSGAQSGDAHE